MYVEQKLFNTFLIGLIIQFTCFGHDDEGYGMGRYRE